jgi:hypothetical protein
LDAAAVMQASIPADQFVAEPLIVAFTMIVDEELGKCTAEVALPTGMRRSRHSA